MSQTKAQLIDGKGSAAFDGDLTVDTNTLYVDSTNNRVGIGTTTPQSPLHVNGTGDVAIQITNGTTGTAATDGSQITVEDPGMDLVIRNRESANVRLFTANTERARIDSSGRLLVGTSSTTGITSIVAQGNSTNSAGAGVLGLGRGTGTISSGNQLGVIDFTDNAYNIYARIEGVADAATGSGDYPGRLVFSTTADGASSPTERMRIKQDGAVWVGSTTGVIDSSNHGFTILVTSSVVGAIRQSSNQSSAGSTARFWGTAGAAYIQGDGDLENTNNRYTGISDIKYKQNIENASSQWDDIKAIQVRKYELIANPDRKHIGVVAQELEQVCPGLVIERNEDDDGTETYKSVAYSVLYMKAVKALQEAMERIEHLEGRLTAAGL